MNKDACKKLFYELVYPSLPNEWEVDGIIEEIVELPDSLREQLFEQIPVIWPVSNSLCLSFLEDGVRVIGSIPSDLVPKWVRAILSRYEQQGLGSARGLIVNAEELFLTPLRTRNMVRFEDISKRMLFYIRGISGESVDIALDPIPYTDTTTFYVPPTISVMGSYQQNQLLYKFILTLHWGFHFLGTFKICADGGKPHSVDSAHEVVDPEERMVLSDFFSALENPDLAVDLFFLIETHRVMNWLKKDLPGLTNEFVQLKSELLRALDDPELDTVSSKLNQLCCFLLFNEDQPQWLKNIKISPAIFLNPSREDTVPLVNVLYEHLAQPDELYRRPPLLELLGKHDFNRASAEIERKRQVMKETFILYLEALKNKHGSSSKQSGSTGIPDEADQAVAILTESSAESESSQLRQVLDNPETELPDELVALMEQIKEDLGHIPPSYFSAASGVSGNGFQRRGNASAGSEETHDSMEGILLDEWDYRRNGYRKNWCRIYERELPVLHSTFVAATLDKHRGLLLKLRRQFEFMKTNEHFVRRQREGDDLDLDAIVEARGDQRAGISPSSKLFVRLQRNERDIATIFLVDMSNSTEGWVGTVIKEALVLLCEVMDVAGDPYGILGFSGMRRSRCDLYRIKDIEEPYNQNIHQRINSILPREYTRIGPALRYASGKLKSVEARTRLLVTITDGKPEDYDDYKGEYAIEDTRKALMEARGSGIHTFCITVDREAHEYLPQMFGRGNYIFIDEIDKLPMRMIDMYRQLTG